MSLCFLEAEKYGPNCTKTHPPPPLPLCLSPNIVGFRSLRTKTLCMCFTPLEGGGQKGGGGGGWKPLKPRFPTCGKKQRDIFWHKKNQHAKFQRIPSNLNNCNKIGTYVSLWQSPSIAIHTCTWMSMQSRLQRSMHTSYSYDKALHIRYEETWFGKNHQSCTCLASPPQNQSFAFLAPLWAHVPHTDTLCSYIQKTSFWRQFAEVFLWGGGGGDSVHRMRVQDHSQKQNSVSRSTSTFSYTFKEIFISEVVRIW